MAISMEAVLMLSLFFSILILADTVMSQNIKADHLLYFSRHWCSAN